MKKSELSNKYNKLLIENETYKKQLENISNSRIMLFINILPKNLKKWLLDECKKVNKSSISNILKVNSLDIETKSGSICIIVNTDIPVSVLNSTLASLMSQTYINYNIVLVSKKSKLDDYPKHDSRISVVNVEKDAGMSSILNELYKKSNDRFFCYIDKLCDFDSNFLSNNLKNVHEGNDIAFEISKSSNDKFSIFLEKNKVKWFIQYVSYANELKLEKFKNYDNIKIKYV